MDKAIDKLRALWAAGEYRKALKLAASWPRLGIHRAAIQKGWGAASNGAFYRQLGFDTDYLLDTAYDALEDRYNLPPRKTT